MALNGKSVALVALLAILIVLGIIGVALSSYYWKQEDVTETQGRFGIVIDAGGSGTRMYIYEYKNNKDYVQTDYMKCEKEGLSQYVNRTQEIAPLLNKCLERAVTVLPANLKSSAPIFMKATAGMRKLKHKDLQGYNSIWNTVNEILKNGSFPVRFVGTMTGMNEAKYSWTTINKLLESTDKTKGLLEVGSTSLQIAFEPHETSTVPANVSEEIEVNNKKHRVYLHSYLCLGKNELLRRYFAKLTEDALKTSASTVIDDPCGYAGFQLNKTKEYLWEAPCVKGDFARKELGESITVSNSAPYYTYKGIGNYSKCQQRLENLYSTKCDGKSTCGINGAYQPKVVGEFMGIGGGAFYAAKFLKLSSGFTEMEFEDKTKVLCETNYTTLLKRKDFDSFALDYCLSNTYTNFLMKKVLKLNCNQPDLIEFVDKINGNKISWTLGSIINDKEEMSSAIVTTESELSSTAFGIILSFSVLVMIIAAILLVRYLCLPRNVSDNHV